MTGRGASALQPATAEGDAAAASAPGAAHAVGPGSLGLCFLPGNRSVRGNHTRLERDMGEDLGRLRTRFGVATVVNLLSNMEMRVRIDCGITWAPNLTDLHTYMCVYVCACVHVCMHACVRACVCAL